MKMTLTPFASAPVDHTFREDAALEIYGRLITSQPGSDYQNLARRAVIATDALIAALGAPK